jgi:hypothetical protein
MIVSSLPDSSKLDSPLDVARELETYVRQAAAEARPLHEVEAGILARALRIGFLAAEEFLRRQGDGDLGLELTTETWQTLHRSQEAATRHLRTVFGEHVFKQFVYAPAPHEKIALRPLDARMQLSEARASYLFEEYSQFFCVDQAFGKAAAGIKMVLGQAVSVDSLEVTNRRMGDQAAEFLDELPAPPPQDEGELLVFTGDGKGVPLVTADRTCPAAFEDPPDRPGNRRMAILAGVYSVDRYVRTPEEIVAALFRDGPKPSAGERPKPQFKQVRACFSKVYDGDTDTPTAVPGSFEAFSWADRQLALRRRPDQPLLRLMDGQKSLWDVAAACLESAPRQQTVDILDILHVSQYVWRAAKTFHGTFEHREAFVRDRLLRILQGDVQSVLAGMRQMATKRNLSAQNRREINAVCGYFQNNTHRMRYDEYLRQGYPIATGVIEGACRHLVKDRMERSGMRWRLDGAQAMLNVRAVWQSSYWTDFHTWRMQHEQSTLHPNCGLIVNYVPTPLPA